MPANSRWDLIRRLRVNENYVFPCICLRAIWHMHGSMWRATRMTRERKRIIVVHCVIALWRHYYYALAKFYCRGRVEGHFSGYPSHKTYTCQKTPLFNYFETYNICKNIKQNICILKLTLRVHLPSLYVESSWNVMVHGDAREGKWRENWRMGSQYSSLYLGTWCIRHYYRWCANLCCQQSTELRPRADLNGIVLFAERRNLFSARVPSHIRRSLHCLSCYCLCLVPSFFARTV